MHPAGAPGFRVQSTLEHGPEDGGADFAPVEILAGIFQQKRFQFFGERRYLDVLVTEQASVDIGECRQRRVVILQIFVPKLRLLVQYLEQLHQRPADASDRNILEVIMEHALAAEDASVLGVEAEHQPDAQLVQAFQSLRVVRVLVLLQQRVVEHPDQLAGLEGDFHFLFDMLLAGVHQEIQPGVFLLQVGQQYHLRLVVGPVHVMDLKCLEIADDDPAGLLWIGQEPSITPPLLERREHRPI